MRETYCEFKNKIKILSCDVSGHLNNDPSKKNFKFGNYSYSINIS